MARSYRVPASRSDYQRKLGCAVWLIALQIVCLAPASWAQALKKVPFPFSPIGVNCLPWFIAKEARIAEKYGIDFDPVFIGASSALLLTYLLSKRTSG